MGKGPKATLMTDEHALIHPDMIDEDNGSEPFLAECELSEGCSGTKKIDTLYENTSQDWIENPREGSTPAPVCETGPLYPHRNL